jgi:hypothetical protein
MADDIRLSNVTVTGEPVTPGAFVCEVEHFRVTAADPAIALPIKARAWQAIIRHASMLDVRAPGFERAGVALKEALCVWLDVRSASASR